MPPPEPPPDDEEPAVPLCDGAVVCGFVGMPNVGAYVGGDVGACVGACVGAYEDGDEVVVATTGAGDGGAERETVGA